MMFMCPDFRKLTAVASFSVIKPATGQLKMVCGIDHELTGGENFSVNVKHDEFRGRVTYTGEARKGKTITLIKYITYHTSSPVPEFTDLADRADQTLNRAVSYKFDRLKELQEEYLTEFWQRSDVVIESEDQMINQNLRLHLYHMLSASARVQNSGIGAKGLTGSGYEGHIFWGYGNLYDALPDL